MNLCALSGHFRIKDLEEGISVKFTHLVVIFQNIDLFSQNIISPILSYGLLCQRIHPILILPEVNPGEGLTILHFCRESQAYEEQGEKGGNRHAGISQKIGKVQKSHRKANINPTHFHANGDRGAADAKGNKTKEQNVFSEKLFFQLALTNGKKQSQKNAKG